MSPAMRLDRLCHTDGCVYLAAPGTSYCENCTIKRAAEHRLGKLAELASEETQRRWRGQPPPPPPRRDNRLGALYLFGDFSHVKDDPTPYVDDLLPILVRGVDDDSPPEESP